MKFRSCLAFCLAITLASCASPPTTAADALDNDKAAAAAADDGDFPEAIRLLTEALAVPDLSVDQRAELTLHRAFAYDENGEYNHAIVDYDSVLEMKPGASQVYFRRGIARREKGEYEQALGDFEAAAKSAAPGVADWPFLYGDRGVVRFALGRYGEAAKDFGRVVTAEPSDAYGILWLHISRSRAGAPEPAKFTEEAAKIQGDDWPNAVLELYRGKMTPQQLQTVATEGDEEERQFKGCEADFFIAEQDLIQGKVEAAKPLLQMVTKDCSPSLAVHAGAAGELRRIGG